MRAACWLMRPGQRARTPGPLRAFFFGCGPRRGQHVAAVATARKLAILVWRLLTKNESYLLARSDLELKAGHKPARGRKGAAHAYNIRSYREQERRFIEQTEAAYARFVAGWNPRGPSQQPRRAQAPQMRSDDKGCAAGLSPLALLFATRSPVRALKDSADRAHFKNPKSVTVWI
jgi:hypothetical protein